MGNLRKISKYNNRRLYDKGQSRYVTLADIYRLILDEVEFVVIDNESQRDITDRVLLQVMSEQERSGTPMLGREFLLQTIRIYGSASPIDYSERGTERAQAVVSATSAG